jgi:hypothetical protein
MEVVETEVKKSKKMETRLSKILQEQARRA